MVYKHIGILLTSVVLCTSCTTSNLITEREQTPESTDITTESPVTTSPEAIMMNVEYMMDDDEQKQVTENMMESMKKIVFSYEGSLLDVQGGNAKGSAKMNYSEGEFIMKASFTNLPELKEGYFYEGWLVRKSPFDFVSTGATVLTDLQHTNIYSSAKDWTDHDFYVLTLEPDDGDPAPAEHVVEGTMIKIR